MSSLSRQYSFRFTKALIRRIDAYAEDLARGCPNWCFTRSQAVRGLVVDALYAFEVRAEAGVPPLGRDRRHERRGTSADQKEEGRESMDPAPQGPAGGAAPQGPAGGAAAQGPAGGAAAQGPAGGAAPRGRPDVAAGAADDVNLDSDPVEVKLWIAHPIVALVDRWRAAAFPEERGRVSRAMAVLLLVEEALEQHERRPRRPAPSRRFEELRRAWLAKRASDPRYARN